MKRRQKRNMMLLGLILALHFIYILAGLGLRKAGIQLNLRWLFWNLGLRSCRWRWQYRLIC